MKLYLKMKKWGRFPHLLMYFTPPVKIFTGMSFTYLTGAYENSRSYFTFYISVLNKHQCLEGQLELVYVYHKCMLIKYMYSKGFKVLLQLQHQDMIIKKAVASTCTIGANNQIVVVLIINGYQNNKILSQRMVSSIFRYNLSYIYFSYYAPEPISGKIVKCHTWKLLCYIHT